MKKTIRWAVCGLGKISRRWLKVAASQPDMKVVACVSSSKERAIQYQKKFRLEHAFTYEELAANPQAVDAVYVCTNTHLHHKIAMLYLAAGIPVLCEKALCVSKADAEQITAFAKEKGVLFMEAMWTRFLPSTTYIREELLPGGALGKIKHIKANFEAGIGHGPGSRVWKKSTAGGSVLDLGVYPASYAHMLLGLPKSISARGKLNKDGVDLCCNAEFKYADGTTVEFRSSLIPMQISETLRIFCEKGTVVVPRFYQAKRIKVFYADGRKEKKDYEKADGFKYEILHFNDLIRKGMTESPIMTHKASVEVMGILEEINRQLGVVL